MLNGYLNAAPNAATAETTVTLTDIPHGYYDIIVYFTSDVADREGRVTDGKTTFFFRTLGPAGISGPNATLARTTQTSDTAWPPANHAIFTGLSGPANPSPCACATTTNGAASPASRSFPGPTRCPPPASTFPSSPAGPWPGSAGPPTLGAIVLQESIDLQFWRAASPQPDTNPFDIPLPGGPAAFFRLARP